MLRDDDFKDLTVRISELLVATADGADEPIDDSVTEVLQQLRQKMKMDVVFVSEFVDGRRVFRFVERDAKAPNLAVGDSGPLEESFCQRVVDGRMPGLVQDVAQVPDLPKTPFRVGAHLSTPIVLPDGSTYGTLCCFSSAPDKHLQRRDLDTLKMCAQLVARKIDVAETHDTLPDWSLQPIEPVRRR